MKLKEDTEKNEAETPAQDAHAYGGININGTSRVESEESLPERDALFRLKHYGSNSSS